MQLSDLRQQLASLAEAEQKKLSTTAYTIPGFKHDDIYPIFKKYFNPKAQLAMANKASDTNHVYDVQVGHEKLWQFLAKLGIKKAKEDLDNNNIGYKRQVVKIHYLAIRSDRTDLVKAVERLIVSINTMADLGFLRASMFELAVLRLAQDPMNPTKDEAIVVSYLTVSPAGEQWLAANMPKLSAQPGQLPARVEDL